MKKYLKVICVLPLLILMGAGLPVHKNVALPLLLDGVALNAAAAVRTFQVPAVLGSGEQLLNYSTLAIRFAYTHANNGTLTFTCTEGATAATATASLTTCTVSSGTCTLNVGGIVVTASLTGDTEYMFPITIKGSQALSCVVAHGGTPAAGDLITVNGYLIAM